MQKPSILLIDDSAMMRRFISLILSETYQVTDCESAEQAMALLRNGLVPDLIITDLNLPGISGMDVIRSLRQLLPTTPLITISGDKTSKTRLDTLSAGADDYVTKPFHPSELAVRAEKLLARINDTRENTGSQAGNTAPSTPLIINLN